MVVTFFPAVMIIPVKTQIFFFFKDAVLFCRNFLDYSSIKLLKHLIYGFWCLSVILTVNGQAGKEY